MKKVLIANRGEVAVRVARACRDYGLASVAVYADADAEALHVTMADEAFALGGDSPADTYLNAAALLGVARRSGADAVHPGYGFLAESAPFARAVVEAGLTWIGPPPECIELLGDKVAARRLAERVGAPLVPGTPGAVSGVEEVLAFAETHGLPVAIKAAFGGGGRGLRVARRMEEVAELYDSAVSEAVTAFGRGECFVERFLDRPRHVEAQVLADAHGAVVVLGTRDCSVQRRNQKLVEEAPAPFLSPAQRGSIHAAAADICAAAGYRGAGTVEFLVGADGAVSFLEVNTRLQVEHPVTEETTGVDIVRQQLRVAEGLPLEVTTTPEPRGHAIEFRVNAEDPAMGFLPGPGRITRFEPPSGPGVRLDSGVASGSSVPGAFDSLLAKLVVTGATRDQAMARARRALAEFHVEGVPTVLPFHRVVVDHPAFTAADGFAVHTGWIETELAAAPSPQAPPEPEDSEPLTRYWIEVDGRRVRVGLPRTLLAWPPGGTPTDPAEASATPPAGDPAALPAPITGTVVRWLVADGGSVAEGEAVAVMEAMKMETVVTAHRSGLLGDPRPVGEFLTAGAALAVIGEV